MSDLLTRDEYGAIATELSLPVNAFIHGRFTPAHSGGTFETINPATGEVLAEVASCDAEDVDRAVVKAREAFERGAWSKMHPAERKHVVERLQKNGFVKDLEVRMRKADGTALWAVFSLGSSRNRRREGHPRRLRRHYPSQRARREASDLPRSLHPLRRRHYGDRQTRPHRGA